MSESLRDLLRKGIVVCDGAVGTMLHSMGVPVGQSLDELNLSDADVVAQVHRAYVEAGAQIVETNTFGANRIKLESYGLSPKVRDVNVEGAGIARRCTDGRALVAGSVGPTGKLMAPLGPLSFDLACEVFREQISALCEGGVDLVIIETQQDLRETKAALLAAKTVTEIPVVCQMSFAQEGRTIMGTDPATAAVVLESFGATLIGTNCGSGPQDMLDAVRAMSSVCCTGVTAQPNAGLPRYHEGRLVYLSSPMYMADFARRFVEAGAVLVGGCCGTTPEHIKAVADGVRGVVSRKKAPRSLIRIAGRVGVVEIGAGKPVLIGSGLTSSAGPADRDALAQGRVQVAEDEAAAEFDRGAKVVGLDCDSAGPAAESAGRLVEYVQMACPAALCLVAADPKALESALRAVEGRPLVMPSDRSVTDALLPVAERYGAGLILDCEDAGAETTPEERLRCAHRIAETAVQAGIGRNSILIKPGRLFDKSGKLSERTIRTIQIIKADPDLGIAVEYLPDDPAGDAAVSGLRAALDVGADALIADPLRPEVVSALPSDA